MADSEEGTGATMDSVALEVKILARQQADHEVADDRRHGEIKLQLATLGVEMQAIKEGSVERGKAVLAVTTAALADGATARQQLLDVITGRDKLDGATDKRDTELERLREQLADKRSARVWQTVGLVVSGVAATLALPQLWELLLKLVHT